MVDGHVAIMHIKLVAMATGDTYSYHGTLLFITFITSFMLCKYHLHTADLLSSLTVFAKKVGFCLRIISMILGVGVRNIFYPEYT